VRERGCQFCDQCGPLRRLVSRRRRSPTRCCPTSVVVDRRRAIWRSAEIKLRYRLACIRRAGLGRIDGRLTPNNTDRTNGAYVRWPLADCGVRRLLLARVEGVATRRHKRCFETTGTRDSRQARASSIVPEGEVGLQGLCQRTQSSEGESSVMHLSGTP